MKEWTKLVLPLQHADGNGTIEISWDDKADAFLVNMVSSAEELPPDSVHMNSEKCIAYAVHAVYDAFHKLLPQRHVDRSIDMMMGKLVEDMKASHTPMNLTVTLPTDSN